MTREGLVSVIVPVRDRPELLQEAAESVFAQTYENWELLIVDDGSRDTTREVALTLSRQRGSKVLVESAPGLGPGAARELGRIRASGEFLQYLDSDDLLRPRKLERQVGALRSDPRSGLAYGPVEVLAMDGSVRFDWPQLSARRIERMFPEFLRGRFWHTGAALVRREVSDRVGPWSALSLFEDWEYDCRLAALDLPLAFVDEVGVTIRASAPNRLGFSQTLDSWRLAQQARALALILQHAQRGGVSSDTPEMAHFARYLFLTARRCGAAGLDADCRSLLGLARQASGRTRGIGLDFVGYRILIALLGSRLGSRLAESMRGTLMREDRGASK